jgi:hypothetical protein
MSPSGRTVAPLASVNVDGCTPMKLGVRDTCGPATVALIVTWCPPHCHCQGSVSDGLPIRAIQ